ncbi:MAG: hypothetical protein FWC50_02935 [Planctomycetaceae bacterium]|nr:hypothetical protein [Planctomycetaceae bacterium]
MARGESQNFVIVVVSFSVVSLILLVATIIMYRNWQDAASQLASATKTNGDLTTEVSNLKSEGTKFREFIGFPDANTPIAEVQKAFDGDMQQFAPKNDTGAPLVGQSYKTALTQLFNSYQNEIDKNHDFDQRNKKLLAQVAEQNQKEADLQASLQKLTDTAQKDLETARTNFAKLEAKMMSDNKALDEQARAAIAVSRDKQAEAEKATLAANNEKDSVLAINNTLTSKLAELESPTVTYSDARIVYVSPDGKTAWIDKGSRDGLQPRISFSVYNPNVKDVSRDSSKAKIEVTKILGDRLAEVRVTEDILIDPIILGDLVYTPVWKPGQVPHFALANGLDIDGDGISDTQEIIKIIRMNGGEVDAYIDESGDYIDEGDRRVRAVRLVGAVTDATRYYVLGNPLDENASKGLIDARKQLDDMVHPETGKAEKDNKLSENDKVIRDLQRRALQSSLKVIRIEDLLQKMGYRHTVKVEGFGKNRKLDDVNMRPEAALNSSPGSVYQGYEKPGSTVPNTNMGVTSPLFNSRKINASSETVSPLFRPRKPTTQDSDKSAGM